MTHIDINLKCKRKKLECNSYLKCTLLYFNLKCSLVIYYVQMWDIYKSRRMMTDLLTNKCLPTSRYYRDLKLLTRHVPNVKPPGVSRSVNVLKFPLDKCKI